MVSENPSQRISHWLRLSVIHLSRRRWMNGSFHLHFCWQCAPMLACTCVCHPARRLNGCSSAHCWVGGLILLHAHYGLALTYPRGLFTHWLFCPLPPTVSLRRIPLLSHQGRAAVYTGRQTHALTHMPYVQYDVQMQMCNRIYLNIQKYTNCTSYSHLIWRRFSQVEWFIQFFFPTVCLSNPNLLS